MSKVHVFKNGTNVRLAGLLDQDNIIAVVDKGNFEALHQSQGDEVKEGNDFNNWWVKIVVDSHRQGWISAVRISAGGNDEAIPGVETQLVEWV